MDSSTLLDLAAKAGFYVSGNRVQSPFVEGTTLLPLLNTFANLVAASEGEECAKLAQEFGLNRPIASFQPSERVIGRWEGEQAASSNISKLISDRGVIYE